MKKTLLTLLSSIALSSPSAASDPTCTDPDGEPGVIYFNSLHGVFQGCTPSGWYAFHAPSCPQADACDPPGTFSFAENTDVPLSSPVLSDIIQISDLDRPASIAISGDGNPEFRICATSDCSSEIETWRSSQTRIDNGQHVQLRLTSSDAELTTLSATVIINGTGAQWEVTTEATGPTVPTNCPNIGDLCSDGTVYAGITPYGNLAMYTTQSDAPTALPWNNGNTDGFVMTTYYYGAGSTNTNLIGAIDSDSAEAGAQPHLAVQFCLDLISNGHDDWFLPNRQELEIIQDNASSIGNFSPEKYWSSLELNSVNNYWRQRRAIYVDMGNGYWSAEDKNVMLRARCARTQGS